MADRLTEDRHERIIAEAERIKALGEASESVAPYAVNEATIGTWLDAMGYDNPRFATATRRRHRWHRSGRCPGSVGSVRRRTR